jgi:hypothetical protein
MATIRWRGRLNEEALTSHRLTTQQKYRYVGLAPGCLVIQFLDKVVEADALVWIE